MLQYEIYESSSSSTRFIVSFFKKAYGCKWHTVKWGGKVIYGVLFTGELRAHAFTRPRCAALGAAAKT